jgi:hypothetical protein
MVVMFTLLRERDCQAKNFKQNTLITPCLTCLYGDKEKTEDSCCVTFLDLPHCMLRYVAGTKNLAKFCHLVEKHPCYSVMLVVFQCSCPSATEGKRIGFTVSYG